jgi:hypothetical protein
MNQLVPSLQLTIQDFMSKLSNGISLCGMCPLFDPACNVKAKPNVDQNHFIARDNIAVFLQW